MPITKSKIPENEIKVVFTPEGLGPWSHSKLKTLSKCPLQFYLKYILKVKPSKPIPTSIQTEVGKAAHRILEFLISGKTLAEAYELTRKEYLLIFTEEMWEENLVSVEHNINSFKERLDAFDVKYGIIRNLQELKVGITRDYKPTGFFAEDVWFRGVIDLGLQLKNKDIIFLDHKFGLPVICGIRNQGDQLDTYKILFHYGIEPVRGATAGIHFIKDGDVILGTYSPREEIEGSLRNRLECRIENVIDVVKDMGYFKHIRNQNNCQWCDFNEACKNKQLLTIEKESKKWFEIKQIS